MLLFQGCPVNVTACMSQNTNPVTHTCTHFATVRREKWIVYKSVECFMFFIEIYGTLVSAEIEKWKDNAGDTLPHSSFLLTLSRSYFSLPLGSSFSFLFPLILFFLSSVLINDSCKGALSLSFLYFFSFFHFLVAHSFTFSFSPLLPVLYLFYL